MLFKTCTYYLLESLVQVFKKDSFKSASWQNLSEFWRLLCLFSAANPSNKSLSFKKRTIQNMGGKLSFFENTPSLSFTLNYLFDKIILDLFRFIFNEWYYTATYYVDIVFHNYDAKLPTFTLSNLEKKKHKTVSKYSTQTPYCISKDNRKCSFGYTYVLKNT